MSSESATRNGPYRESFYRSIATGSQRSASVVVPQVLAITGAKSVVDVGCGIGTWAREFLESGVSDVLGMDGDYVERASLKIDATQFLPCDLRLPLRLERAFDLAVSLEVAEHLPKTRAASFVSDLTCLAPVVLFSAAIPGQGGLEHINEQWPDYWAELFAAQGYRPLDCLRRLFWSDDRVELWYRQNLILFARADKITQFASVVDCSGPLSIVHPEIIRNWVPAHPRKFFPALTRLVSRRIFGEGKART